MRQYSKAVSKKMRELCNQAYERELRQAMAKLAEQFTLWQNNQIDTWDLAEAVHKFHNGPARELYQRYTMLSPAAILPYALFKNLITYEELPDAIADAMKMIASNLYEHNRVEQEYYDETE